MNDSSTVVVFSEIDNTKTIEQIPVEKGLNVTAVYLGYILNTPWNVKWMCDILRINFIFIVCYTCLSFSLLQISLNIVLQNIPFIRF